MELATVNDKNPGGDTGLDAVCPAVALDGTDGKTWRRRASRGLFPNHCFKGFYDNAIF